MKRSALSAFICGAFLLLTLSAAATVTVTGHVKIGDTTTPGANVARVRFELIRCVVAGQNTPRVLGATNFKPTFDVTTFDGTGAYSVSTYGNDEITCDQVGNSRWKVTQIFSDGTSQFNVYQCNTTDSPCNLDSKAVDNSAAVAYQPNAVVTNPSGDQTVTQPGSTFLNINRLNVATCTGCGTGATLQTNGVNNSSQTNLNLQSGTGTTATNPSAGNVQVAVNYGSTGGTAAQGNDSRITGAEQTANKNAASGYAGLDSGSRIVKAQAPSATVYTDQANTWGAFLQKFQAGANHQLVDPTDTTKVVQFDVSNVATSTTRTVNFPNAPSTTVQPDTGAANNFISAISAQGVITKSQPSFANLSGAATSGQLPGNVAYTDAANLFSATQTFDKLGTATSGANFNSNIAQWASSFWNGSVATQDLWTGQSVLGSGTNPTSTWTFSHSGSTGNAQVRFAAQKSLAVIADQTVSPICAEGLRASDSATMWSICYSSGNAVTFTSGGGTLVFANNGSARWQINSTGHLIASTDNTPTFGATGANRPSSIYAATDINLESVSNGAQWKQGYATELLTLSTVATTTDTAANLLPANAIIEAVEVRVTTTITTATNWSVGDATTAARFCAANATLTSGTTSTCTVQADQTGAAGPRQTAAAKVRITTTGTPGAGAIRITVFYRVFTPPTS